MLCSRPFDYQPGRHADDLAFARGTTSNIRQFSWFRPFRIIDPDTWMVFDSWRCDRRGQQPTLQWLIGSLPNPI